jgi:hypothetical protein
MQWIAPSEKNADNAALEKRLWDAADQLRANSELKSQEYSAPVFGLTFLRFAEVRFTARPAGLEKAGTPGGKLGQLSNGVAQQNVSPVLASKMEFARRPRELRQRFAALAEPMIRCMAQLYYQFQNLRRTRDLPLPRLLSGQVKLNMKAA